MHHLTAMAQALAFIERNLQEEIRIADVAEAVAHSLFHFCRVFNAVVQHTPYDYLIRRRLSEAALVLQRSDQRVSAIACDYRFNSAETFARAFKRMFNQQPNQWRRQAAPDPRQLMPPLDYAYLRHLNQGVKLPPTPGESPEQPLWGVMTLIREPGDPERRAAADLWRAFLALCGTGAPGNFYGVRLFPEGWQDHGFFTWPA